MMALYNWFIILLAYSSFTLAQEPPFTVTQPNAGDTLILGANELSIEWSVPSWSADQPVSITLQQGEDVASLGTVEIIDATASNNGSYTWQTVDSTSLVRTACNYTVRLTVDGLVAYSSYFTIINADDGLVPNSATCPVEQGTSEPQLAEGEDITVLAGGSNGDNTNGSGNNGGGISTSTLAVAIVVPIVVLLIIFGLLIWLGIRRAWFVKFANRRRRNSRATHENTVGFSQGPDERFVAPVAAEKRGDAGSPEYGSPPQELHAEHRPWEAEVREVYQLEGDERDARFGDGNMRGS